MLSQLNGYTPELLYLLHGDPAELAEMLSTMRPADVADAMNHLDPGAAAKVLAAIPFDLAVQVLDQPELESKAKIFGALDAAVAAPMLEAMSADERADIFRHLTEGERHRFIKLLDEQTRHELERLLDYEPDTAGGIMTTEFVSVPAAWTVEQTLRHIREVGQAKETVYTIYVVDRDQRLVRAVSLRDLLLAERTMPVVDVVERIPVSVLHTQNRDEVTRLISKYNLLAIPVVDEHQRILGIVTVDDVIDAIVHERSEDVVRFGGMGGFDESYNSLGFVAMIKKRAPWLCALFLSEMLTATAMQKFQGEIERAAVLAMFIPLVMSSGGNSGSQATSLIIRALALREVKLSDWWRTAIKELPTGLTLGAILGVIGIVRILLWQKLHLFDYGVHYQRLAITIGVALVGIVGFGSLAGSMLPFLLRKLGFDPASASAPFVATLVDVTGLVIYFSVAYLILHGTLL